MVSAVSGSPIEIRVPSFVSSMGADPKGSSHSSSCMSAPLWIGLAIYLFLRENASWRGKKSLRQTTDDVGVSRAGEGEQTWFAGGTFAIPKEEGTKGVSQSDRSMESPQQMEVLPTSTKVLIERPTSAAKRNENFFQPYALLKSTFFAPSSSASRLTLFDNHWTVTATGAEGMPLATTTSWLGPSSWVAGTSK